MDPKNSVMSLILFSTSSLTFTELVLVFAPVETLLSRSLSKEIASLALKNAVGVHSLLYIVIR